MYQTPEMCNIDGMYCTFGMECTVYKDKLSLPLRLGDHVSLRAAALLLGGEGRGPVYARQALTNCLYRSHNNLTPP